MNVTNPIARQVLDQLGWRAPPRLVRIFASGPSIRGFDWGRVTGRDSGTMHVALNFGNVVAPKGMVDVSVFMEGPEGWEQFSNVADAIKAHDGVLLTTTPKSGVRRQVGCIDPRSARDSINACCGATSAALHLAWLLGERIEYYGVDMAGQQHADGSRTYFSGSARARGWENARRTLELFTQHLHRSLGPRELIDHSNYPELAQSQGAYHVRKTKGPAVGNEWSLLTTVHHGNVPEFERFWPENRRLAIAHGASEVVVVISEDHTEGADDLERKVRAILEVGRHRPVVLGKISNEPLDFSRIRRESMKFCRTPWVMVLDPDESLDGDSWEALKRVMMDPVQGWDICHFPTRWVEHGADGRESADIPGPSGLPWWPTPRLARISHVQFGHAVNECWLSARNAPAYCGGVEIIHHCFPGYESSWLARCDELVERSKRYSNTAGIVRLPDFELWRMGAMPWMVAVTDGHEDEGAVITFDGQDPRTPD